MSRLTNKWNDEIRNQAISIIHNLTTENGLSFDELGVLSSFLVIERTENSKLAHYEDMEEQGLLTVIDNETFQRDTLDRCTHRHCNKCDKYRRDLQRYKDMENEGRLIELPCAVGDEVFIIWGPRYRAGRSVYGINTGKFRLSDIPNLNNTVFVTREAAEAKLKGMEGAE